MSRGRDNIHGTEGSLAYTQWDRKDGNLFSLSATVLLQVRLSMHLVLYRMPFKVAWWNSSRKGFGKDVAYAICHGRIFEKLNVERYVGGLPDMIHGSVKASKPQSMQEAIEFATEMMDKKSQLVATQQACEGLEEASNMTRPRTRLPLEMPNNVVNYTLGLESLQSIRCITENECGVGMVVVEGGASCVHYFSRWIGQYYFYNVMLDQFHISQQVAGTSPRSLSIRERSSKTSSLTEDSASQHREHFQSCREVNRKIYNRTGGQAAAYLS
ncbi:hypothetical protein Tco_0971676 [Tanacetum coccineum]